MHFLKKYKNIVGYILLGFFVAVMLVLSVRGLPGNPTPAQLNTLYWKDNGPFELSPERGRFAFLYSLVENHSFQMQPLLANFTAPDVGYLNNHYVSIFAPSISFLAIPGYIIGKHFDLSQFGAFLWMSIFALFNVLLIRAIATRMGANPLAASIAAITFLFATPAFPYAVTIYEHHPSTFLLLLSFYLYIRFNNLISLIVIWILYAFSFTVDYPNLFILLPIAVATFMRNKIIEKVHKKIVVKISLPRVFAILGVIIPLVFLFWVNQMSYNNPFRISGTIQTVEEVSPNGAPIFLTTLEEKALSKINQDPVNIPPPSALSFFNPRNMLNGFYILLISPDRGILMYTPVILFGIWGMLYAIKKKEKYVSILLGVVGFNFILYSMWGDPYGGWAFGGRYLIPTYAVLAIYLAILLTRFGRKRIFIFLFFVVFAYSALVNTLGAITSNNNPPQIQAEALSKLIHSNVDYTYIRNVSDLNKNISKSFVFQAYAKNYMSAWQYYSYIVILILIISSFFIISFHGAIRRKSLNGGNHAV